MEKNFFFIFLIIILIIFVGCHQFYNPWEEETFNTDSPTKTEIATTGPTETPTPEPTETPTPEPTATPDSTLSDDFQDGTANGWTVTNGSFNVIDDSGNMIYNYPTLDEGRSMAGNLSWTDYYVEAKVRVLNFNGSNRAYICGRYTDGNNFYAASLTGGTKLEIRKKVSGSTTTLIDKTYTINTGQWYTVKLEMLGSNLKMYVNGILELEATDASLSSGAIGIISYKVLSQYDDINAQ